MPGIVVPIHKADDRPENLATDLAAVDHQLSMICAELRPRPCAAGQAMLLPLLEDLYQQKLQAEVDSLSTFFRFVVEQTGLHEKAVQRALRRGRGISQELLERVRDNVPGHGQAVVLDLLLDTPVSERRDALEARLNADPATPAEHPLFDAFVRHFTKAPEEVRAVDSELIFDFMQGHYAEVRS